MIRRPTNTYNITFIHILLYLYQNTIQRQHIYTHTQFVQHQETGADIPDIPDSRIELRLNWWRPLVLAATTQGAHLMSLLPPLAILCNTNCLVSYLVKTLQYQLMPPLAIPSILPQYSPMLSNTGIAILWNTLKYPAILWNIQQHFEISSNTLKRPI